MALRLVFMGTPAFAVPTLEAVSAAGHSLAAVYTQPPRPAGRRGLSEVDSPVALAARRLGIPVHTPDGLRSVQEEERLAELEADAAVVVAYGLLLPPAILAAVRLGCYNAHASLLPRWRGAAPIQRAILAGDRETGVMIMKMDAGLDSGPIALAEATPIGPDETAAALAARLADRAAALMVEALGALEAGGLELSPQPAQGATYARKIDKAEARIDWTAAAEVVHNRIRGLSPFPGAWCEAEIGGRLERVKLLASTRAQGAGMPGEIIDDQLTVACGDGAVRLVELQRAGGRPLAAGAFLHGSKIGKGMQLS